MFAVSTFDAVGGLILGTIGGIGLVVNDLFEQWRNRGWPREDHEDHS